MYKYEMDPTRTVGATEQTRDAGRTDRQTDGVKPIYPPNNFVVQGVQVSHWDRVTHMYTSVIQVIIGLDL